MSFLKIKKNTIYLQLSNSPKLIRPLYRDAEGYWVHNIPSCSSTSPAGKKEIIRFYRQVDSEFSSYLKDNQDPLWDQLDNMDKFNRQGDRQDFSIRPIHVLPVWDHEEQDVKVAKQGNQFFEEMVKWYDQGGDVTACDWMAYTEGNGRRVQYKLVRQDQTEFQHPDLDSLQQKSKEMMHRAICDLRPFKTDEELVKFILAQPEPQQGQVQQGQPPQPQVQMPAYTPGGNTGVAFGSVPPSNPLPQTMQPGMPAAPTSAAPMSAAPTSAAPMPAAPMPAAPMPAAQVPQVPQITQPTSVPGYMPQPPSPQVPQPVVATAPAPTPQQMVPATQPAQDDVPNAPVGTTPVYAPPVQTKMPAPTAMPEQQAPPIQQTGPGDTVIDFGKHSGKTLGWILENERSYLTFLKGNKKHLLPAIDQLMGGDTATPVQDVATPAAPASAPPELTPATATAPAGDNGAEREQILDQLNQKFLNIPDFQGPGIAQSMLPFLQQTIGTTNFSIAPLPDLVKLNAAVDNLLNTQEA